MDRIWTPVELIRWTERYLADRGFEDPRLNAELLLAGVLRVKRLDLYLQFDRPLTVEELAEYKTRLRRRLRHEPLQYIGGTADFRHLTLKVDRRVLIPRPETEILAGEVLAWSRDRLDLDVLEIGTGSGAIALSLRCEGRFHRVVATDLSPDALEVARANANSSQLNGIEFRHGHLYRPIEGQVFDVIVSNPPYVAERARPDLPAEVVEWEPASALFAGADGLAVIREMIAGAPAHLRPGGLLALEFGAAQADAVADLVRAATAFGEPMIKSDLAGHDRILLAERRPVPHTGEVPASTHSESQRIGFD